MILRDKVLTSGEVMRELGPPTPGREGNYMGIWIPDDVIAKAIPAIPRKVYCNKKLIPLLDKAFKDVINCGYADDIRTWDGCFNVRTQKGAQQAMSLHSWGLAIDINAAWNGFHAVPTMPQMIVTCFERNGFDWGGKFSHPDGMHFQISRASFLG